MDFTGKVVLVTGAASGIGRASALLFGKRGASVAVVARDPVAAAEVVEEIKSYGSQAAFISADMRNPADIVSRQIDQQGAFLNVG